MLETSARLLGLLSLLQARRDWSGTELAERLDVTTRTVRNDIERLRALGYPVDATRGAGGGYRLGSGSVMPPLVLDDDEAVAIAVSLRHAGSAVVGIEESSVRALAKLDQVLPARLRRPVSALGAFSVPIPAHGDIPAVDAATLMLLTAACRDQEQLRFDYRDHHGKDTRRVADPYRLVSWGRRWYLVAWDSSAEDWRTFRVDRMTPKPPAGPRYAARPLPAEDIAAYVEGKAASARWRYRARVRVHAPADVVEGHINPGVGTVEAVDEATCILHTGSDSVETMAVFVSLLGVDFDVLDPPELTAHVAQLAVRYARAAATS